MKPTNIKTLPRWVATFAIAIFLSAGLTSGTIADQPLSGIDNVHATSTTVYITPKGKRYHKTPHCPTLHKSKVIHSVDKSSTNRPPCKVCYGNTRRF